MRARIAPTSRQVFFAWRAFAVYGAFVMASGLGATRAEAQADSTRVKRIDNRAHVSFEAENGMLGADSAQASVYALYPGTIDIAKTVDRARATLGDTLLYTLIVSHRGVVPVKGLVVRDALPAGLRYLAGSLRLDGTPQTNVGDFDATTVAGTLAAPRLSVTWATSVAQGTVATITFLAVVDDSASAGYVTNVANAAWEGSSSVSGPAVTLVELADIASSKTVPDGNVARAGSTIRYRLGYTNRSSSVTVRDAYMVDTLPVELDFVSAEGMPTVNGRIVRWSLGELVPGQSGSYELMTRIARAPADGARILNTVVVHGRNTSTSTALALVGVLGAVGKELQLTKTAGVLEASLGEAVPYMLVVKNVGAVPLGRIVVRDLLPHGMRVAERTLRGADSASINGQSIVFHVAGPLAPNAELTIRYAAVVAAPLDARRLENIAVAQAEGGLVQSDTARAWVRLRRDFAARGRSLVGKVWLDQDDNGVQDPGETGVAGVQVWSADGEVVQTDKEGRFSFRDLAPGVHGLRLDPFRLPSGFTLPREAEEMVMVRTDGWTMPRVTFRLVPRVMPATLACECEPPASLTPVVLTTTDAPAEELARVAPLRSAAERAAELRQAFIAGPVVRITSPSDGTVLGTNRLYVGVQGEVGATVRLFDGDSLLAEKGLRPDGTQDFIGIAIPAGPHRLRVSMRNSSGNERWDSVAVHGSGVPAKIEVEQAVRVLRIDSPEDVVIRARILDRWNVPLASVPNVTVAAMGAAPLVTDADASSVGLQRAATRAGWVEVSVRAGNDVGPGEVTFAAGPAKARVVLRILPTLRALAVTGVAQAGVGAAPASFGAVTAQGAVSKDVTVSVTYDSRRANEADNYFERGYDPTDADHYATFGDNSERRIVSASTKAFSARVERELDYVELGDIRTSAFTEGRLGGYQRSLTGLGARVSTGAVVWNAFGSVTSQAMQQRQIRGNGTSGPFALGNGVRPGTERVVLEVRDLDNASRVIARQELMRFTDYQVEYEGGIVRLNQPVASVDSYGNPIYLIVTMERLSGGDRHFTGGLRAEMDVARWMREGLVDSLGFGLSGIHDGGAKAVAGLGARNAGELFGADFIVKRGGLRFGSQLLLAQTGDSTATASRTDASWTTADERASLGARSMHVGRQFAAPGDPSLSAGVDEVYVSGELAVAENLRLRLRHEQQRFSLYGISRRTTSLFAEAPLAGRRFTQELALNTDMQTGVGGPIAASAVTGKASLAMSTKTDLWLEGSPSIGSRSAVGARPSQFGVGASYRILPAVRLESSHRWTGATSDSTGGYGVSAVRLRMERLFGGQVWGGVERAGEAQSQHAAVLGWNQRLALGAGWSATSFYERRFRLDRAPLIDPLRALPFAQQERNHWAASSGVEWLPGSDRARMSVRGELRKGADSRGFRLDAAADAPLGAGAALLTRHDWSQSRTPLASGQSFGRIDRSLLGMAIRPVGGDVLNALAKVEWRRTLNPTTGQVLGRSGDDRRMIASTDAVWAPTRSAELAVRYALRWGGTDLSGLPVGVGPGAALHVDSRAQFFGARGERRMWKTLRARLDGRLMMEQTSGARAWNAAPSLVLDLNAQLQLEGGYRFGNLVDPDFAATGGSGLFAMLGVRFTERSLVNPAAFWRERVARDR